MDDNELPLEFGAAASVLVPRGWRAEHRVLDPIVVLRRDGDHFVADLAGVRHRRGVTETILALSPKHTWVSVASTLFALPTDAPDAFARRLAGLQPNSLSFKDCVRLVRDQGDLQVETSGEVFASGLITSESLLANAEVPGLQATLFPYQAQGVLWMRQVLASAGGLLLADEMGLGKTLQAIAVVLGLSAPRDEPVLVLCPGSLIANWMRELQRFAPSLVLLVHRGAARTGVFRGLQGVDLVVTTYDTLVNDIGLFKSVLWTLVVCDEAQAIKNPDSIRRHAVGAIPRRLGIAMTGTPVENSLLDLWSLADFCVPDLLGSREAFEEAFPDAIESARELQRFTAPLILRRRVDDVAKDLPPRTDIDVPLELGARLAAHYRAVRLETLKNYPAAANLVATLQLQLVCAHPWLRSHGDRQRALLGDCEIDLASDLPLITPKVERCVAILDEALSLGRKVLVFASFNGVAGLLRMATEAGWPGFWGVINGTTRVEDRQRIVDDFSSYAGAACLILNPKVAGAGLNISAATVVVHFSPQWNPAVELQASARAHRRGQTNPVFVYRLFYEDTVERVMIDRSAWKTQLGDELTPMDARDRADLERALRIEPLVVDGV